MANRGRRRTRWYNYTIAPTVLASAQTPGNVSITSVLTESIIETDGLSGGTLLRIIGNIAISRNIEASVRSEAFAVITLADTAVVFVAANLNYTNIAEELERPGVLWTAHWSDIGFSDYHAGPIPVDVRRKAKLTDGMDLNLTIGNPTNSAAGTDDLVYSAWLRMLVALP